MVYLSFFWWKGFLWAFDRVVVLVLLCEEENEAGIYIYTGSWMIVIRLWPGSSNPWLIIIWMDQILVSRWRPSLPLATRQLCIHAIRPILMWDIWKFYHVSGQQFEPSLNIFDSFHTFTFPLFTDKCSDLVPWQNGNLILESCGRENCLYLYQSLQKPISTVCIAIGN